MHLIVAHHQGFRTYVSRELYFTFRELTAAFGWRSIETDALLGRGGSIRERLLRRFDELPEALLICESYNRISADRDALRRLGCRLFVLADDLHARGEELRHKRASFELCDRVLSTYGNVFAEHYPEIGDRKVAWVPHAASPDYLLPFKRRPRNVVLLSGAVSPRYPLRLRFEELRADPALAIVRHPHPGYRSGYDYDRDDRVGRGYAERIRSCRAALADASDLSYLVAKHFEIPATGALLLAGREVAAALAELGFVDGRHYLSVAPEEAPETIRYLLDEANHDRLDEIREAGQRLVRQRHTTAHRAAAIDRICRAA